MKRFFILLIAVFLACPAFAQNGPNTPLQNSVSSFWKKINGNVVPVGSAPVIVSELKGYNRTTFYNLIQDLEIRLIDPANQNVVFRQNGVDTHKFFANGYECYGSLNSYYAGSIKLISYTMLRNLSGKLVINGGTGLTLAYTYGQEPTLSIPAAGRVLLGTTVDDGVNALQVGGSANISNGFTCADSLTQEFLSKGNAVSALANDGTWSPLSYYTIGANDSGNIFIVDRSEGQSARFFFHGATVESADHDHGADFSNVQGTDGKVNVYITGGTLTVENKDGAARALKIHVHGFDE